MYYGFQSVWLVDFTFTRQPGEHPRPTRVAAREWPTGRSAQLDVGKRPLYPIGHDSLLVTYDAPAALGCHLTLGWPLPACILDLHAEFRCLTSGLIEPGDYSLQGALNYFVLPSSR